MAAGREILVQHGHTPAREADGRVTRWIEFVPYDELCTWIDRADNVVCHGGVGTIMTVLASGRKPIVVPRLKSLGEHIDDHQLQIAQEFAGRGFIYVAQDADGLSEALTRPARADFVKSQSDLRTAVVEAAAG